MEDYQMAWHVSEDYPEWGSAPRKPLIQCDMAHKGELLDSVIGAHPVTGKPMVYHVLRCELCIAIHLWPMPSDADLALFYAREFYQHEKPDMIARYERDAVWWKKCMHGPMLDSAAASVQTERCGPLRILDIGAGPGLLLRTASERGWQTNAIEPSKVCADRLRTQVDSVWHGTLADYIQDVGDARPHRDIVTMWETLEHVSNPEETLLHVWDLLKPGGVVAVCVPNEYSPGALEACRRFRLPPWWISAPAHCWMFTPKTLQLLLRRAGFSICYTRMTYPLIEEFILKQGRCYIGNDVVGRSCHAERMIFELGMITQGRWQELEEEYVANVAHRVGREIIMIARKIG